MPRSRIHYVLLFLWLFAIFAPTATSVLSEGNKTILTFNLNEEEQKGQEKIDIDEKLIVEGANANISPLSHLQSSPSYDFSVLENFDHISEIILPPPEYTI